MRTEAYSVGFDTKNYHAPVPDNYSEEEILRRREGNIHDNIIRYLGEYRLGVKYDEFHYDLEEDEENGFFLSSPHADPGPILNIYRKAIAYREERGLPVDREVADCLGFQKLQVGLKDAPVGTLSAWVSPFSSKREEYGDYSFTFIAQVVDEEGRKRLRVIPYRNELTLEEHKRYFKFFHEDAESFDKDIDFIANPVVIQQSEDFQTPDDIISFIGETEEFNIEWRDKLTPLIAPLVGGFIQLVRNRASGEDLVKARHAIENFVLAEKDYLLGRERSMQIIFESQPREIFEKYGNVVPPVVGGSCGSSARGQSGDIFNSSSLVNDNFLEDKYGSRTFECPSCGGTNLRPEGELLSNCQHCGSDNVSCDTEEKQPSFAAAV